MLRHRWTSSPSPSPTAAATCCARSAEPPSAVPDADAITQAALTLGAATLGESGARRMHARVKPAWAGARLAAPAYPVRCTGGDNLGIHVAGGARAGRRRDRRRDGWRARVRLLGRGAHHRRESARDPRAGDRRVRARLATRSPPTDSRCSRPASRSPARRKEQPGAIGQPVTVGDVIVEPGDWIVADVDGVVVVPGAALDDVLTAGRARADKESALFEELARRLAPRWRSSDSTPGWSKAPERSVRGVVDLARTRHGNREAEAVDRRWSETGRRLCTASGGMCTRSPCAISRVSSPMVMRPRPAVT